MKNSMTTTNLDSIKSKYVVSVFILHPDNIGKRKSKNTQYVFEDDTILENRRKAILKAEEISNSFNIPSNKNFKGYLIEIFLIIEENGIEYENLIYGANYISYFALEQEALFFKEMSEITKFINVENNENETFEVIEENLSFFLSKI
ncbi:hypothetical protein [Flavobacterium sp. RSSB_23]|uniref:hypothetical protein n=1 Tax=Flavobacterium sp. RSSB_23 TaxID=3447668 RepID=UPI003F36DA64